MTPTPLGPDAAHGGEGWVARSTTSIEEIGTIWGQFGSNSEYAKLRRVVMCPPHPALADIQDAASVHWIESINVGTAKAQFDQLREVYVRHGVEVLELNPAGLLHSNLMFARDLFAMTPAGAILARPASSVRAGEEVPVNALLANNKIPTVSSVVQNGTFEGSDLVFFARDAAFVGCGVRTNEEGVRQVSASLALQGIRVVAIQTTYGCGHLDGVLSIVGPKKAVLYTNRVSFKVFDTLKSEGYSIIPIPDQVEAEQFMAINMVALEPDHVLITTQSHKTREALREHGVKTIPVDVSELMKAGGAIHCLTGVVQRELI